MPQFDGALVRGFQDDLRAAADEVFEDYADGVRSHGDMPRDRGTLADGIQIVSRQSVGQFIEEAVIASTAVSEDGADYGSIIDQADGKIIRPVNKKALANTRTGWGPYASARQSVKHRGWWNSVNEDSVLRRAMQALGKFGL